MTNSTRCRLIFGALLATACGNGDDSPAGSGSDYLPDVSEIAPSRSDGTGALPSTSNGGTGGSGAVTANGGTGQTDEVDTVATRCTPPVGVSGSPQTMLQAIALMNALPRPTTLECFVESLDRPLSLYLTSSGLSLQPSPGARSPRTFIIKGALAMSVVPDGSASSVIELGWRTTSERSIKAEIEFPLQPGVTVTAARLFDRVVEGDRTKCGQCHSAETHTTNPDFPEGAFESEVLVPYSTLEVSVDLQLDEVEACDPAVEPRRCALLDAIYSHGDVVQSPLWLTQPLPQ